MAVARQFDRDQAAIADLDQGIERRRKIDLAEAELQVLVNAAAHVLDLHVDHPVRGPTDAVGNGCRLEATAMPDVEGQAEGSRRSEEIPQSLVTVEIFDHHAWLGFESELDARLLGRLDDGCATVDKQVPGELARDSGRHGSAPERHRLGTEVRTDPDRPPQQLQAAPPVLGRNQGGTVLVPRIEQIPGTRFDHDSETGRGEPVPHPVDLPGEVSVERVEMLMIKSQGYAVVSETLQHRDDVLETMVGEAVGAVTEAQRRAPARPCRRDSGDSVGVGGGVGDIPDNATDRAVVSGGAHVGDTLLDRARAHGKAAVNRAAAPSAPERAATAACRGSSPRIPAPTARCTCAGCGSRTTAT